MGLDGSFTSITSPDANNPNGSAPKAYITIIFFDERFNFVSEGSTALRVTTVGDNAAPLVLANIKSPKNGYAYVYLSNESNEPVYFDNFQPLKQKQEHLSSKKLNICRGKGFKPSADGMSLIKK